MVRPTDTSWSQKQEIHCRGQKDDMDGFPSLHPIYKVCEVCFNPMCFGVHIINSLNKKILDLMKEEKEGFWPFRMLAKRVEIRPIVKNPES